MYNITRAKAAQVVQQTLTALTGETWNVTLPGAHLDERKIFPMSDGRLSDRCWKIESDASIQARNTYERTELVSPVLTWEQMPLLQQIIRDLRKAGAKSDPSTPVRCPRPCGWGRALCADATKPYEHHGQP